MTHLLILKLTVLRFAITSFFLFLLTPSTIYASNLYKYQDEQGRWHFTDTPPQQYHSEPVQKASPKSQKNKKTQNTLEKNTQKKNNNLAQQMQQQIKPKNAIEIATMAVVGIQTHFGSGSGFFISDQGHIITNRHVIRAKEHFAESEKKFAASEAALLKLKKRIDRRNKELKQYEKELKQYAQDTGINYRTPDNASFKEKITNLKDSKKEYDENLKEYNKRYSKWDKAHSDFKWRQSMAGMAQSFTVILKNNITLKAQLVHLSDTYDLALLKINGYETPYLPIGPLRTMAQGDQVYAIGSPLGQQDSVSAGILTSLSQNTVVTDSQILPGNSGGPLITPDGKVIAINTARVSEVRGGAGFGHSIPIDLADKNLSRFYKSK